MPRMNYNCQWNMLSEKTKLDLRTRTDEAVRS